MKLMFHRAISTQQIHCLCQLKGNGSMSIYFPLVITISLRIDQYGGTILRRILLCGCLDVFFLIFFYFMWAISSLLPMKMKGASRLFQTRTEPFGQLFLKNYHWLHSLRSESVTVRISHAHFPFLTNHTKGVGYRRKMFCPGWWCWIKAGKDS